MEIVIGIVGLVITILLWLFPPEPLRRLFGVKEPEFVSESTNQERKRDLTEAFKAVLEDLEVVEDNEYFELRARSLIRREPISKIIERSKRERLLAWIDSLDDELLLVTLAVRNYWQGKDWREGVPKDYLTRVSHPLGKGRGISDLEKDLVNCGVLAPSNEELFDYGANLQVALDYIDLVDWDDSRASTQVT
ncbi:MAG: hypothetical protein M5U01_43755 [Ardenticatenaceae bacterium]|nr:hypothetical protein [Ardenticatenaceae bacterium]